MAQRKRKIRSGEEAARHLAAARASGKPRAAWAVEHGLDARSLNAWRLILERRQRAAGPRWVELVAAQPSPPPVCRIRCGLFELEAAGEFDDERLGRLLRVMAASC